MKNKLLIVFSFLVLGVGIYGYYFLNNTSLSIEDLFNNKNITYDQITHIEEIKDHYLVFYTENKSLSYAAIKKNLIGYNWVRGGGTHSYEPREKDWEMRQSFSNVGIHKEQSDFISFAWGVIYDDDIIDLTVTYNEQVLDYKIISTSKGRFWFALSDIPLDYDPKVVVKHKP